MFFVFPDSHSCVDNERFLSPPILSFQRSLWLLHIHPEEQKPLIPISLESFHHPSQTMHIIVTKFPTQNPSHSHHTKPLPPTRLFKPHTHKISPHSTPHSQPIDPLLMSSNNMYNNRGRSAPPSTPSTLTEPTNNPAPNEPRKTKLAGHVLTRAEGLNLDIEEGKRE